MNKQDKEKVKKIISKYKHNFNCYCDTCYIMNDLIKKIDRLK